MSNFVEQVLNAFMNNANGNGGVTKTQQEYIDTIKSGDASRGEQLAMNLCGSMGLSKEQAIAQARQFFHI